jgi:hypothetical protein
MNIDEYIINFIYLLDENIINFDLIIDLLVHKQTIIQENIIDLYEKTKDLLNCNSDNLSKTYIKTCNDLFWYNFNNIYYKRCIKQLFFYEKYKIPNCIKIINNSDVDIHILYSFDVNYKMKKKDIFIKNDINNTYNKITLNKINNVNKYITPIIKKTKNYYINLYDNNIILFCILYKNIYMYNINIKKMRRQTMFASIHRKGCYTPLHKKN